MIKEDIATLNACVPNNKAAICVKQKLIELKGKNKSTIGFHFPKVGAQMLRELPADLC